MQGRQLPLRVQLAEAAGFASFFAGSNPGALAAAQAAVRAPGWLYLYGPAGVGKSHLLQAATRAASEAGHSAAYLPLRQMAPLGIAALEGLDAPQLLALDELDAVCHERSWALGLLRLLDERRSLQRSVLVAAGPAPDRLPTTLPDLRTRLSAYAVHGLQLMSDAQRSAFLQQRARARGLELGEDVGRYLLNHLPRDTGSLLEVLDRLDRAALSAQRRLTLPFVQQALRDPAAPAT